jgi:cytidine deaminase
MKKFEIKTTVFEYDSTDDFSDEEKTLINKSKEFVKNSYAPYSKFSVSAAVLLENGEIITGTNQENAAYPSGMCAERVAVFYANSQYPEISIKALAVSVFVKNDFAESPIPPCGACRQVLIETETRFKKPIKIIMVGKNIIRVIDNAKSLLPLHFDEHFLG